MDGKTINPTLGEFYRMTIYDLVSLLEEEGYTRLETNIWNKDSQELKLILKIEEVE